MLYFSHRISIIKNWNYTEYIKHFFNHVRQNYKNLQLFIKYLQNEFSIDVINIF